MPESIFYLNTIKDEKYELKDSLVYLFTYLSDETLSVEADITDNWVETNYSVQDHIALKPRIIRLRGFVGETVYKGSNDFNKYIQNQILKHPLLSQTISKCEPLISFIPTLGSYTQSAINLVGQVESSFNRYKEIYNRIKGPQQFNGSIQKETVDKLINILNSREEVEIGGYAYKDEYQFLLNNENSVYYLQSVTAHQGDSQFISDIELVIKEVRIATTKYTKIDSHKYGSGIRKTEPVITGSKPKQSIAEQQIQKLKNVGNKINKAVIKKSTEYIPIPGVDSPAMTIFKVLKQNPIVNVGLNVVQQMQKTFIGK